MSTQIAVVLKVRPLIEKEKLEGCPVYWSVHGNNQIQQIDPHTQRVKEAHVFDHVFDARKTNADLFGTVVQPIVESVVHGINGTVFAYGQTSSGKTHTMVGDTTDLGITRQAVEHIFQTMMSTHGREFLLRASYVEIYNEKVIDLLKPSNTDLKVREEEGQFVIKELTEEVTSTTAKVFQLMLRGEKNRRIAETNMNERSSRSHTIFRLILESREAHGLNGDSDGAIQVSHLYLVDLAGSEKTGQMNATADRFKEGCLINLSLTTLGKVIRDLSEGESYINYRGSNLTKILQPSLGGNALTAIVCTVTPAIMDQTVNTIKFAQRAKKIKNQPVVNEVLSDAALIKRYTRQLAKLQSDLAKSKSKDMELEHINSQLREKDMIVERLQQRIDIIQEKLINSTQTDVAYQERARAKRRQTWCASGPSSKRMSFMPNFVSSLHTVVEEDSLRDKMGRNSLDSTVDSAHSDYVETPLEDFEQQLMEFEQADDEFPTFSPTSYSSPSVIGAPAFVTVRRGIRSDGRMKSQVNALKEEARSLQDCSTPPTVLRARAKHYEQELSQLIEFTQLEDAIVNREKDLKLKVTDLEKQNKSLREKITLMESKQTDFEYELELVGNKHRLREKELRDSLDEAFCKLEDMSGSIHSSPEATPNAQEVKPGSDFELLRKSTEVEIKKLKEEIANLMAANQMYKQQLDCERNRVAKLSEILENSSIATASSLDQSCLQEMLNMSTGSYANRTTLDDMSMLAVDPLTNGTFSDHSSVEGSVTTVRAVELSRESPSLLATSTDLSKDVSLDADRPHVKLNLLENLSTTLAKLANVGTCRSEVISRMKFALETFHADTNLEESTCSTERVLSDHLQSNQLEEFVNQESQIKQLLEMLSVQSAELEVARTTLSELVTKLERSEEDLKIYQEKSLKLEAEVSRLSEKVPLSVCDSTDLEKERLRVQCADQERTFQDLFGKLEVVSSEMAAIRMERDALADQLTESKVEVAVCVREIEGQKAGMNVLQTMTDAAAELDQCIQNENEYNVENKDDMESLVQRNKELETRVFQLTEELKHSSELLARSTMNTELSEQDEVSRLKELCAEQEYMVTELSEKLSLACSELTKHEQQPSVKVCDQEMCVEESLGVVMEEKLVNNTLLDGTTMSLVELFETPLSCRGNSSTRFAASEEQFQLLQERNVDLELQVKELSEKLIIASEKLNCSSIQKEVIVSPLSEISSSIEKEVIVSPLSDISSVVLEVPLETVVEDMGLDNVNTDITITASGIVESQAPNELSLMWENTSFEIKTSKQADLIEDSTTDLGDSLALATSELAKCIEERAALMLQLETSRIEIERLVEENVGKEAEVAALMDKLSATSRALTETTGQHEAIVSRLVESEKELQRLQEQNLIGRLEFEIKELSERLEMVSSSAASCTDCESSLQQLEVLREKYKQQGIHIQDLTEQLSAAVAELSKSVEERDSIRSQLETFITDQESVGEPDTLSDVNILALRENLDAVNQQLLSVSDERDMLSARYDAVERDHDAVQQNCEQLRTQVDQLTEKLNLALSEMSLIAGEREILSSHLEDSKKSLKELEGENVKQKTEINVLMEKLAAASQELKVVERKEISQLEVDIPTTTIEIDKQNTLESDIRRSIRQSETESSIIRSSVEHEFSLIYENCIQEMEILDEYNKKDFDIETLTDKLETSFSELNRSSTEQPNIVSLLENSKKEFEQLRETSVFQKAEIERLTDQLSMALTELANVNRDDCPTNRSLNPNSEVENNSTLVKSHDTSEPESADVINVSACAQGEVNLSTSSESSNPSGELGVKTRAECVSLGSNVKSPKWEMMDLLEQSDEEEQAHCESRPEKSLELTQITNENAELLALLETSKNYMEQLESESVFHKTEIQALRDALVAISQWVANSGDNQVVATTRSVDTEVHRGGDREVALALDATSLMEELETVSSRCEQTSMERDVLSSLIAKHEQEMELLKENYEKKELEVQDLSAKLSNISTELTCIGKEREHFMNLVKESEKELELLREEREHLVAEITVLSEKLSVGTGILNSTNEDSNAVTIPVIGAEEVTRFLEKEGVLNTEIKHLQQQLENLATQLSETSLEREEMLFACEKHVQEITILEGNNKNKESEIERLTETLTKTCRELEEHMNLLEDSKRELEQHKEETASHEAEMEYLSNKVLEVTSDLSKISEERDTVVTSLKGAEEELEKLRAKEEELNGEIKELQQIIENFSTQLTEMSLQHDETTKNNDKCLHKLEEVCKMKECENQSLAENFTSGLSELFEIGNEREELKSVSESLRQELKQTDEESVNQKAEIERLCEELSVVTAHLTKTINERDALVAMLEASENKLCVTENVLSAEITQIQENLNDESSALTSVVESVKQCTTVCESRAQELEALLEAIKGRESELCGLNEQVAETNRERDELSSELENSRQTLKLREEELAVQEAEVVSLSEKLSEATSELARLSEERDSIAGHVKEAEGEVERLSKWEAVQSVKITDLMKEMEKSAAELRTSVQEKEMVSSLYEDSEQKLKELQEQWNEQEDIVKNLRDLLDIANNDCVGAAKERDILITRLENYEQKVASLNEDNATYEAELGSLSEKLVKESREVVKALSEQAIAMAQLKVYEEKLAKLEDDDQKNVLEGEVSTLKERLKAVTSELTVLVAKHESISALYENTKREMETLQTEHELQKLKVDDLSEKLVETSSDLAKSMKELQTSAAKLEDSEKEAEHLRKQNAEQETELRNVVDKLSFATTELTKTQEDCDKMKLQLQNANKSWGENSELLDNLKKRVDELQLEKDELVSQLDKVTQDRVDAEKVHSLKVSLQVEIASYKATLVKEINALDPIYTTEKMTMMDMEGLLKLLLKTVVDKQMEIGQNFRVEIESLRSKLKRGESWTMVLENDNEKLQNDLSEAQQKNEKLSQDLKEALEESQKLLKVKTTLKERLNAKDAELCTITTELESIKRKLKDDDKIILDENRITELETLLDEESAKYVKAKLQLEIYEKQNQSLMQQNCNLQANIGELERNFHSEVERRMEFELKLSKVQAVMDAHKQAVLQSLLEKFKNFLGQDVTKEDMDLDSLVDSVTFVLVNTQNEMSSLQQKLIELEKKSEAKLKTITEEKLNILSQLEKNEVLNINANLEMASLRKEIEGLNLTCGNLRSDNSNSEQRLADLQEQMRDLGDKLASSERNGKSHAKEVEGLHLKLKLKEEQLLQTSKQVSHLEERLNNVNTSDMHGAASDRLAELERDLEQCNSENLALEEEKNIFQEKLDRAQKEITYLQKNLENLMHKYEYILQVKDASELQQRLNDMERKLGESEKRTKWLGEENDELEKLKISLEGQRQEDLDTIEKLKKKLHDLSSSQGNATPAKSQLVLPSTPSSRGSCEFTNNRIKELERNLTQQERQFKQETIQLRYKLRETELKLEKASAAVRECDDLRASAKQNCLTLALKDEEISAGKVLAQDLEAYNEHLRGELEQLTSAKRAVEDELARLCADRTQCDCDELRAKEKRLQAELNTMKGQVAKLQLHIEIEEFPFRKKVEELQVQLEQSRQRNHEMKAGLRKAQIALNTTAKPEECPVCVKRSKLRDQEVQTEATPMSISNIGSGIVREHSFQEIQRECMILREKNEAYKRVARDRLMYIKKLETEKENTDPSFKRKYS